MSVNLSIKTYVSLLLQTRGEKEEEKMKKKRKRRKKETLLCSKQCRRVGPEQKTFHTQENKNDFWFLVLLLVGLVYFSWVGGLWI